MRQAAASPIQDVVEQVTFHNADTGFCVLRVKARGHRDLAIVVGHAATISPGEWITATGDWVNDRTHGQQFKARFLPASAPSSAEGIERYLAAEMIRGIGPAYANGLYGAKQANAERLHRLVSGPLPWAYIDPEKALPWIERKTRFGAC